MSKKILIIEDDEDIREGVRLLLESEEFSVIEAKNGAEGLELIRPDTALIILDIMMPGMNGLRTCEEIRKISNVPVLFLTAKARESAADLVLLDNGYGTGETFDWSRAETFEREFILAGGLTPGNIPEAILRLHPLGVDISSGVETDHFKDREKILAAVRAAHGEGE